jgi:threonine aldolase
MTAKLAAHIRASGTIRLAWEPQANEIFAILKKTETERLRAAGAVFYDWNPPHNAEFALGADEGLVRMVTSFATGEEDVDGFRKLLG